MLRALLLMCRYLMLCDIIRDRIPLRLEFAKMLMILDIMRAETAFLVAAIIPQLVEDKCSNPRCQTSSPFNL